MSDIPYQSDRVLRAGEAARKLGVGRTAFYELRRSEGFPTPIILSASSRGYSERELDAWIASRPRAR